MWICVSNQMLPKKLKLGNEKKLDFADLEL